MNPNLFTVVKVASRNFNVVDETGTPLVDCEGNPVRFLSATAAKAEIAASLADVAAEGPGELPEAPQADPEPVEVASVVADPASMPRVDRLMALKAEVDATKAWKAAGADPATQPPTPIGDWMAAPTVRVQAKARRQSGPSADLLAVVRAAFAENPTVGVSRLYSVARAAGVKASKSTMEPAVVLVRAELATAVA